MRGDGDVPAGFVEAQLRLAGESLARKRERAVRKVLPGVTAGLGGRFAGEFEAYCVVHTSPAEDAAADAIQFARWLRGRGGLPAEGEIEVARLEVARGRWPRVVYVGRPRTLAVVFRWGRATPVIGWGGGGR